MEAFSERFDDLEAVDFIRANTIGVWGEMQNLNELPGREWAPTLCWLGDLHRKSFSHVLLALNFFPGFRYDELDAQIPQGSRMRRDSPGSTRRFPPNQKDANFSCFPDTILGRRKLVPELHGQAVILRQQLQGVWRKVLSPHAGTRRPDAMNMHSNYLQLCRPPEVTTGMVDSSDVAQDLAVNGGCGLAPNEVSIAAALTVGGR